ncbi:hypothetical protein NBRC111893_105 [Lentilactobacillus kosonis]|uniref:Uncharacterized protein n=1 Tax=Lentilactobacillus kosonis TaxID=2810561 RepID=A0A401FHX1_9LACO|nr:hypothetical protein NBRC111893_105 [Lentilactobacillus kosonis]
MLQKIKFEEKILNDLERQFKARKVFNDYIIVGQTTLTPLISNIKYKKMNNFNRDDVKNEIEYINNSSNKELLIQTKYFEIAIRKGFLENFDEIWNAI